MTAVYLNQSTPQSATPATKRWALPPETVHLWWLSLDGPATDADADLLSRDEHCRAERLAHSEAARRFRRGRAHLRRVLASYLGTAPRTLRFAYTPNGKPSIQDAPHLSFSLAHSGDIGLLAVTYRRRLGVDVELSDRTARWLAVARRCLSEDAWRRLQALPEADRVQAVQRGWTRHEALLKASGQAALRRLLRWETPCTAHPAAFTIQDRHGGSWLVKDVVREGVCAALAVERWLDSTPEIVTAGWL
ncbi:MAG: 4'-phosphopantetheinyl transferase superfamily protein [Chloracidobacterium sp.]|nr:4'-phosphopantetheinyl transferase superfamily protein [Chloracidobacterium sp.]MDW8217379.1 4'-phosphopantetheinyl transferase superfamily protein [Acidobacteriota bacterium]